MKFFNRKEDPPPPRPPGVEVQDDKTLLKLARRYIDEKNMKEAQKCCNKILQKNEYNYMALVLLGKSLEGSKEAGVSYVRAIHIKPQSSLAWQGLAKYYEEKDDSKAKIQLLAIYNQILKLQIDDDCAIKTLKKYGQLGCQLKNSDTISSLIKYLSTTREQIRTKTAEKQFMELLRLEVPVKDEDVPVAKDILKKINNTDSQILLGKLILQNKDFPAAVIEVKELEIFSQSIFIKEWLCEFLCKTFVEKDSFCGFKIEDHIDELTNGVEDTKYGKLLQAMMHYTLHQYEEAYQKCSFVVRSDDVDTTEALFILNCSVMMRDVSLTENLLSSFLQKEKLKGRDIVVTMRKKLLSNYIVNKQCYQATCIAKEIPIDEMDSVALTEMGKLFLETDINSELILATLQSTDYLDLYKALAHIKQGKYSQAVWELQCYNKHPVKYYYLAQVYWKRELFSQCARSLQTAVQFMPDHPKVFYCLGLYYYHYKKDTYESIVYLERSHELCKTDMDVIKLLSITYDEICEKDWEIKLLLDTIDTLKTKEFWVYTRLGRLYFFKKDMDAALEYLQKGLNLNPRDLTAHEWIADIYYMKKNYSAALTSYEKVVNLSNNIPLLINCINRIGSIYTHQGYFDKATLIYEKVLEVDTDNLNALKGLINNRIRKARHKSSNYFFTTARQELQKGAETISAAISRGVKSSTYFHLLGDVLVSITRLPKDYCFVHLPNEEGGISRLGKFAMYDMAIENFAQIARFRDAYGLFKCAHTYLEYYIATNRMTFWQASYNLAVLSVKVKPDVWRYWDLLGKVCYFVNKCNIAHLSFFKALTLNKDVSSHKVWCNLGTLYLKINKHRLARYCFSVGQNYLPSYPQAWIGDGLLAEIIREDGNVGLFGPNPYSNEFVNLNEFDFRDWILTIHNLSLSPNELDFDVPLIAFSIVPFGMDITEWYLSLEQHTFWSSISMGIIQEKKGLISYAATFYKNAYSVATGEEKDLALIYTGRVLVKQKRYNEAINVLSSLDRLNLEGASAFAYALYQSGYYEQSYTTYYNVLNSLCTNDNELVDVLIEMTNVAYKLKGYAHAVSFLLQAIEKSSEHTSFRGFNLQFLKSYVFGKVDAELAGLIMTDHLENHENDGKWWYQMGLHYLRGTKACAKLASLCIKKAIKLSLHTEYNDEVGKMHAMTSIAEFYSGNRDKAMKYALRALNVYPEQEDLWAVLILCVLSHREWPDRYSLIASALHGLRQITTLSQPMKDWLFDVEKCIDPEVLRKEMAKITSTEQN